MPAQILYTVAELSKLWRRSKGFVYAEIASGRLPAVDLGRGRPSYRIPEEVADAYWKKQLAPKKAALRVVA